MKKLSKNMIFSIIYKIIYIITGFIVQKYVLSKFGSDINGLYSSISQFLSYLLLLESGIGTASIQALYKPLANDDWDEANSIMAATKQQYARVCGMFVLLLTALSFLIPCVVAKQVDAVLAGTLTFISGLSSIITYAFLGKYKVLLTADNRIGFVYALDSCLNLASCAGRLVAIKFDQSIVVVQSVLVVSAIAKALIVYIYVKRHYQKLCFKTKPNNKAISQRWSVLIHQIAGLVVNHTDVTILTVLSTLQNVSIYSVYNYVFSNISNIINTTFSQAITASFGRLTAGSQENYNKAFKLFETLFNWILFAILSTALTMILPFISLYTASLEDTKDYMVPVIAILFCVCQIMNLVRIPAITTINAYGWFKATQKGAIIEAIINIVVSLSLVPFLGMKGLLLGTVASYFFRTQDLILFVYKKCGIKYRRLVSVFLGNLVGIFAVNFVTFYMYPIKVTGWFDWIFKAFAVFVVNLIIFFTINYISSDKDFNKFLGSIFRRAFKKKV